MSRIQLRDHLKNWSSNMRARVERIQSTTTPKSDERIDILVETHHYSRLLKRVVTGEVQFKGVPGARRCSDET